MSKLVLARIGETDPDRRGQFANSVESFLSPKGRYQTRIGGLVLAHSGIRPQVAYAEHRGQAEETFKNIMLTRNRSSSPIPLTRIHYLNPRRYGKYANTDIRELCTQIGADHLHRLLTRWEEPIEDGESLQDVHLRVGVFHRAMVLPRLLEAPSNTVLVIADRDPLIAYRAELDLGYEEGSGPIQESAIAMLELGLGDMRVYSFDREGTITGADTLSPTGLPTS